VDRNDATPNPLDGARLGVLAAVTDGDAGLAFDLVNELLSSGVGFETVLFDVIAPLQEEIGARWHQGDFGIAEEHAATGAIETVVALLAGSFAMPDDGPHVVVACAEGDAHSLPARMISAYLVYLGWRVTFLGPSVPADDLGVYLAEMKPDALILSCAIVTRLPGARACIRAAHGAGVPVLAGGRGFGPDGARATAVGADAWAMHPAQIADLLATWQPTPEVAEAAAADPDDEMGILEMRRLEILTTAAREVTAGAAGPALRVRSDLGLLFDATIAALLVDDPTILDEFATWHRALRSTGDGTPGNTRTMLDALRHAVHPFAPIASAYLEAVT
jgi:methanogenic corrinoid protein MtbC1